MNLAIQICVEFKVDIHQEGGAYQQKRGTLEMKLQEDEVGEGWKKLEG